MLVLSVCWVVPYAMSLAFITGRVAWQDLLFCSLIMAAVLPATEIRYYYWACHRGIFPLVMDGVFVAVQCVATLLYKDSYVAAIAIGSMTFAVIYMMVVRHRMATISIIASPADVAEVAEVENLSD